MSSDCQLARLMCRRAIIFGLLLSAMLQPFARADVIVLANRTGRELSVRFMPVAGQAQPLVLPIDETVPLFLDGKANISFSARVGPGQYLLDSNCAYYFGRGA